MERQKSAHDYGAAKRPKRIWRELTRLRSSTWVCRLARRCVVPARTRPAGRAARRRSRDEGNQPGSRLRHCQGTCFENFAPVSERGKKASLITSWISRGDGDVGGDGRSLSSDSRSHVRCLHPAPIFLYPLFRKQAGASKS
jgi:hypothetical protein